MNRKIINTNIRFNLDSEADRKAWKHLRNMDRKKYKSYTKAVVIALNDYFDRQERLANDAYLETREKEDAFLKKVLDTVKQGFQEYSAAGLFSGLTQLMNKTQSAEPTVANVGNDDYDDTALEFADSF